MTNETEKANEAKTEPKRVRIQIEFSEAAQARLEELRKKRGAATNTKVVKDALRLLDWFTDQKAAGARFSVSKPGTDEWSELELIFGDD